MLEMYKEILHISGIRHKIIDDLFFYRTEKLSINDSLITGNEELKNIDNVIKKHNIILFHFVEKLDIQLILDLIIKYRDKKFGLYFHTYYPLFEDGTYLQKTSTKDTKLLSFINSIDFIITQDNYSRDVVKQYKIEKNLEKLEIIKIKQFVYTEKVITNKIKSDKFRLGFIGSFSTIKGFDFLKNFLIKYGKILNEKGIEFNFFTLDNPGNNEWIQNNDLKVKKYKNSTIYYNSYDRKDIYSIIDCLIIPSIWNETGPMVLYEAFANKIPVIVSDQESLTEKVIDRVDSYVIKTSDEKDLLKAILWMQKNYNNLILNNTGFSYNKIENFKGHLQKSFVRIKI